MSLQDKVTAVGNAIINLVGKKQDKLVSGTNIKTINGNSVMGSGNITIASNGANVDLSNLSSAGNAKFTAKVDVSSLRECKVIIETYESGTSGYRIWSDGYCEQWGYTNHNTNPETITFLKTFKDTSFCILLGINHSENAGDNLTWNTKTTTSFILRGVTGFTGCDWKASGYLAGGGY